MGRKKKDIMKRVFIGGIHLEVNSFSSIPSTVDNFSTKRGNAIFEEFFANEYLREQGCELIPSLWARAPSGGQLKKKDFIQLCDMLLSYFPTDSAVDGVYLCMHGSMDVEEIGSGETWLVRELRRRVGNTVPICIALDIHASVTDELAELANSICCFRTVPHIDMAETQLRTAHILVRSLKTGILPVCVYMRTPLLISGEAATTDCNPMKSLLKEAIELEAEQGILSEDVFCGMIYVDSPSACAGAVVIAESEQYRALAFQHAKRLCDSIWNNKLNFTRSFQSTEMEHAAKFTQDAVASGNTPVFLSDSGDNVTAGASGARIDLLSIVLEAGLKNLLVAGIYNKEVVKSCMNLEAGQSIDIEVTSMCGDGKQLHICGVLNHRFEYSKPGRCQPVQAVVIRIMPQNTDIIFLDDRVYFTTLDIFQNAGTPVQDYDIIIVKQGYLFAELAALSRAFMMVITPGDTCCDISMLNYKRLKTRVGETGNFFYVDGVSLQ